MIIENLIKDIAKIGAKLIFNKKEKSEEKINIERIDSTDIFKIMLNKLANEGRYNEAENLIFEELEKNNNEEVYECSVAFYKTLLGKSDAELESKKFPRKEVQQGLRDIEKFKIIV
ncbi:MAG: DUF6483 family protein [Clostridium sp.]